MADYFPKDLLVALPVLGTALAVSFDVGYFYGIDINLFTLFSVSEHVTFALQALPAALFLALCALIVPIFLNKAGSNRLSDGAAAAARAPATSRPFYRRMFFWLMVAVTTFMIYHVLQNPTLAANWVTLIMAILVTLSVARETALTSFLGLAAVYATALAFATGLDLAIAYRNSSSYPYVFKVEGAEIKARVVRSGEKGLLYFEAPSNDLRFVAWSDIKGLSRPRAP
jgi:hypothetical protein